MEKLYTKTLESLARAYVRSHESRNFDELKIIVAEVRGYSLAIKDIYGREESDNITETVKSLIEDYRKGEDE